MSHILHISDVWKINGKGIYTPDANTKIMRTKLADENSGRTDDGKNHIKYIRTDMYKVYINYSVMTTKEWKYMIDLIDDNPENLRLTFPTAKHGIYTIDCYTGDDDCELYSSVLYNGLYRNCTFNCIEN